MKTLLDEVLCKNFPKIFAQRDLPMDQTCMCWGFECGDGWYKLIYTLCESIQKHCDENPDIQQVQAVQVKEKFGSLRFYTYGGDDFIYDLIDAAERESMDTCEECGSREKVTQSKNGWITFLCEKCHNKPTPEEKV